MSTPHAVDLTEEWREYVFIRDGREVVYRIEDPRSLYMVGEVDHRVTDGAGITHHIMDDFVVFRFKTKNPPFYDVDGPKVI